MPLLNSDQIFYLQNVLGIKGIILPRAEYAPATNAAVATLTKAAPEGIWQESGDYRLARLIVVSCLEEKSSEVALQADHLTGKILQAMRISSTEVFYLRGEGETAIPLSSLAKLRASSAQSILIFGVASAHALTQSDLFLGQRLEWENKQMLIINSLQEMLMHPETKKSAWGQIQQFMLEMA